MTRRNPLLTAGTVAVSVGVMVLVVLGMPLAAQGQAEPEAGMQVLTRGPVHEAFAEASMTGATAGLVITKAPYDPITEMPPDQRPEGANIAWIPGYWSYDDDRSDFLWVSGVWRDIPPGRQWVPGYWTPVSGGSQWISGFWGVTDQRELTYLPPPPEPLEVGPSSPAPAPDNVWASGSWVWQRTSYSWQPGYWVPQQPDWIWCPAHYTWTPRGYVYVPGYWDHDLVHRGVMFAPVYYDRPVYRRPSYVYSPSIIIDLGVVAAFLFVQPRSHHYYYGDYYDHRYEERGFRPWYSTEGRHYGYDPMYSHYRSQQLRIDPDWDNHVQEQFTYRRNHIDARPPQTLALQVNIFNSRKADTPDNMFIGRSFAEAAQSTTAPQRFAPVNMDERKRFETRGREVRQFQTERAKLERAPRGEAMERAGRKDAKPVKMRMPVSPVAASATQNVEGMKSPPPMPVAPRPQAVEGAGRSEKPARGEVRSAPASRERPGKVEARPATGREKPNRVESAPEAITPEAQPRRVETRPSQVKEKPNRARPVPEVSGPGSQPQKVEGKPAEERGKPNRVGPNRESIRPQSEPQNTAPQQKPAKREKVRVDNETRQAPAREARPEAGQERRQVQEKPQAAQPQREMRKPEKSKPEATRERAQPKSEPRVQSQEQDNKREKAPGKEADKKKKKKNEER